MSDEDPLLFWLSQEPVDSNADIYLPPDTPTQSARVLPQIRKKKRIKRSRTIERLRAYTLEQLSEVRRAQTRSLNPSCLPPPTTPYGVIEFIEGEEFLVDNTHDIVDLFELTRNAKENGVDSAQINASLPAPPPPPPTEEQQALLNEKKEYKINVEKEYNAKAKAFLDQYDQIVLDLVKEEGFQPATTSAIISPPQHHREESEIESLPITTTSSLPLLPPRVSRRDPRLALLEHNKNHTSHQLPTNR